MDHLTAFESLLKAGIAAKILADIGFDTAGSTTLKSQLRQITPSGGTAMLDSIGIGIGLILSLNEKLEQLGMNKIWNFVHIVLTDGQDCSSKSKLEEISTLMLLIGATLKTSMIKTYFIGVDVEQSQKAILDITQLTLLGGENAEFYKISDFKIGDIFEKIKFEIGVQKRTEVVGLANKKAALIGIRENYQPILNITEQRYVVLFNLDISGSMSGSKWNRVCNSVNAFIDSLGSNDLVGCIVFNDKSTILKRQVPEPKKFQEPKPLPITSSKPLPLTSSKPFPSTQRVNAPLPIESYSSNTLNFNERKYSTNNQDNQGLCCCNIF